MSTTLSDWLTVLGFGLSSSIDNFGVGVSYGITRIKIGMFANTVIAIIAFVFSMIGIYFGKYIGKVMPGNLSTIVAALFLAIIGVRIILITVSAKKRKRAQNAQSASTASRDVESVAAGSQTTGASSSPAASTPSRHEESAESRKSRKSLNQYLDDPGIADKDKSGEISIVESLVLGVAVSMNALTNGLGAGLMGLSPLMVSIVTGVFSFIAIYLGVGLGVKVANIRIGSLDLGQFSTIISGAILLLIGAHMIVTAVSW